MLEIFENAKLEVIKQEYYFIKKEVEAINLKTRNLTKNKIKKLAKYLKFDPKIKIAEFGRKYKILEYCLGAFNSQFSRYKIYFESNEASMIDVITLKAYLRKKIKKWNRNHAKIETQSTHS